MAHCHKDSVVRTYGHTPHHAWDRNLGQSIFPMTCSGNVTKASGIVRLPNHIFWSGDPLDFDLSNLQDRVRVYELVLRGQW